jgi:translation initiation factor 2B subunit (eIF-2B alpha/beta/delta family)
MQRGEVDLCLVGADRVTRNGDVCNKIGTYLKALAARDNEVPFYVAFPFSTFDGSLASGRDITIEERDPDEVTSIGGQTPTGELATVMLTRSRAVTRLSTSHRHGWSRPTSLTAVSSGRLRRSAAAWISLRSMRRRARFERTHERVLARLRIASRLGI